MGAAKKQKIQEPLIDALVKEIQARRKLETVGVLVRCPKSVVEALKEEAKAHNISMNTLIVSALKLVVKSRVG